MERAVRLDGSRLISVLESTVRNLELLAILPDKAPTSDKFQPSIQDALHRQSDIETSLLHFLWQQNGQQDDERLEIDDVGSSGCDEEEVQHFHEVGPLISGPVAARLFPRSLHRLLHELKEDRAARETLRKLSATSVSPTISRLTQAWMQLIINTDAALTTTFEQDERFGLDVHDSMLRLRGVEDDRVQAVFELAQIREARIIMSERFAAQRSRLEAQLYETKRAGSNILEVTARDRKEHLQVALSRFETQNANTQEQLEAVQCTMARRMQTSQEIETGERKYVQRGATELRELIRCYDDEMDKLDVEIEAERAEVARLDTAIAKLAMHFARIDQDHRDTIEEQRAIDLAGQTQSRMETLFSFVLKIQAVVRGFLTRKRVKLEARRRTHKKIKAQTKKKSKSRSGKKAAKKPSKKSSRVI